MIIGAGAGLWGDGWGIVKRCHGSAEGTSCGGFVVLAAMKTVVVKVAAGENFQRP